MTTVADCTMTTTTCMMKQQEFEPTMTSLSSLEPAAGLGPEDDYDTESSIREEKEQRACKISVTVVVPPHNDNGDEQSHYPWYYGLHLVDRTILCDGIMAKEKTVCAIGRSLQTTTTTTTNKEDSHNCLLKGSPFREGDILTTVNNAKVKNVKMANNRLDRFKKNNKKNGGSTTVTLVVEPSMQLQEQQQQLSTSTLLLSSSSASSSSSLSSPSPSFSSVTTDDESFNVNPAIVQAFCRKPTPETMVGIGFHTVNVPTPTSTSVDSDSNNKGDDKSETSATTATTDQDSWDEEEQELEGTEDQERKTTPTSISFLQINYLDPNGLLSHSVLNQGDTVLFINGISMEDTTPEDAVSLVQNSKDGFVNIVALNPKLLKLYSQEQEEQLQTGESTNRFQRWMKHAKRAGVAVGGGAMVGVGLVFIPTLPLPFGEALFLGGVSVLGTEFEAPKRVMKSARDKLESVVGRNEEKDEKEEEEEEKVGEGDGKSDREDGSNNSNNTTASVIVAATATATATNISNGEESLSKDSVFFPSDCHQNNSAPKDCFIAGDDDRTYSKTENTGPAARTNSKSNNNNEGNDNTNTGSNRRIMKDRVRGFGRQYVLPFLDQVVGDRKEVEIKQELV